MLHLSNKIFHMCLFLNEKNNCDICEKCLSVAVRKIYVKFT